MSQIPLIHKLIQHLGLAHEDIEWYIQNIFISLYDFKFITHDEINDIFKMVNDMGDIVQIKYKDKLYCERSSNIANIAYKREEYDPDIVCNSNVDDECGVQ